MSFPTDPQIGEIYFHPDFETTFIWYGEPNGWQRSVTSAVQPYGSRQDLCPKPGDTTITFTDWQLTSVVSDGVSTDLEYNADETLKTITTITDEKTTVETFVYADDSSSPI